MPTETLILDILANMLDAFYAGTFSPVRDYLLETLDEGSPDHLLTESGVWRGTLGEWLEVGPGLVRRVPVERVELVDRKPWERRRVRRKDNYCWWGFSYKMTEMQDMGHMYFSKDTLPQEFFANTKDSGNASRWYYYDTPELALADASRRAIAWARLTGKETA